MAQDVLITPASTKIAFTDAGDATTVLKTNEGRFEFKDSGESNYVDIYANDIVLDGNLTVAGTTTTVDTSNVLIEDPVLQLAKNQTTGTPTVDIGFLGLRGDSNNAAFIWDESADQFATILTTGDGSATTLTPASYADFKAEDGNFNGHLNLAGDDTSRLYFSNKIALEGQISNNNLDLGESFGNIRLRSSSDVFPTNSVSLGTSSNRWTTIYGAAGDFSGNLTVGGSLSVSGGNVTINNSMAYRVGGDGTTLVGSLGNASGVLSLKADSTRDVQIGSNSYPTSIFVEGTNGRVGIGTTSPSYNLEIYNSTHAQLSIDGDTTSQLVFGGSTANRLIYREADGNLDLELGLAVVASFENGGNVGIGTSSPAATLHVQASSPEFRLATASSNVVRLRTSGDNYINTGQNLGIGTTSPATPLEVSGTIRSAAFLPKIQLKRTGNVVANGDIEWLGSDDSVDWSIRANYDSGGDNFNIKEGSTSRLYIKSGNVGIGVSDPDQKLEVAGVVKSSGDPAGFYAGRADGSWLSFGSGVPTILLRGSSSTNGRSGAIQFKEYDGTDTAAIYSTDGNDSYGFVMPAYQGDIKFATGSLTGNKMVILSGGSVGIGTSTPSYELEVSGSISNFGDGEIIRLRSNDYILGQIENRGTGADYDKGYFRLFDTGTAKVVLDSLSLIHI